MPIDVVFYDRAYFEVDPTQGGLNRASGYTNYPRMSYPCKSLNRVGTEENSTGNSIGDIMKHMNIKLTNRFVGKTVLVLGSAYGYEVYWLRQLGILAHGLDVSQWAYDQADASLKPDHLTVGDARTLIPAMKRNAWDYIFSRNFLSCMSDDDLLVGTFAGGEPLIENMNRVGKNEQLHVIYQNNPTYYNNKTLTEWQGLPFATGTILVQNDDYENYVTVI
jgi:hypothetical protein